MTDTAVYALVLTLAGGPLSMLAPVAVARLLAESHADRVADDISHLPRLDTTPGTTRKELINR